jgi:hypothetical protein
MKSIQHIESARNPEKNYCTNCGEKLAKGANFCVSCGKPTHKSTTSSLAKETGLTEVRLKLAENSLPSYARAYKKPLNVVLDNKIIMDIAWGQEVLFTVTRGKHTLELGPKWRIHSSTLTFCTGSEGIINLKSFLDIGTMSVFLVEGEDTNTIDNLRKQAKRRRKAGLSSLIAYYIGIIDPLLGLGLILSHLNFALGIYLIVLGFIFLGLGFMIRKGSLLALLGAITIYGLDGLVSAAAIFIARQEYIAESTYSGLLRPEAAVQLMYKTADFNFYTNAIIIGIIVVHLYLLSYMIRGVGSVRALKKNG